MHITIASAEELTKMSLKDKKNEIEKEKEKLKC